MKKTVAAAHTVDALEQKTFRDWK